MSQKIINLHHYAVIQVQADMQPRLIFKSDSIDEVFNYVDTIVYDNVIAWYVIDMAGHAITSEYPPAWRGMVTDDSWLLHCQCTNECVVLIPDKKGI